jgi:flagellar protein FliS
MIHAQRYTAAAAGTASKERLMVMLFEKALLDIRSGAAALEEGRLVEGRRALGSALAIVTELHATLDATRAPKLCDLLGQIYQFVCGRLGDASLRNDPKLAREAERAFSPIAHGFSQAALMVTRVETP